MNSDTKKRIIEFNRRFNLKTKFFTDESVLGYSLNNTIYINSGIKQDYERTNLHEVLHFFVDSEEFKKIKQQVLKEIETDLDKIKAEYELRYFGVYSEDEIKSGVLEDEIVIDLLIDNSVIKYDNGLYIRNVFLGNVKHDIEQKRFLIMTLKNNIKNMNLSIFEKLFVVNYYNGKDRKLPECKGKGKEKQYAMQKAIKEDISLSLQKLYEMSEQDFKINPESKEIYKEYERLLTSLKRRGEYTYSLENNKERQLQELANKYSKQLWEEYKHIVDILRNADYEPAFKYLILNETLTKIYKKNFFYNKPRTIVVKRDLRRSIADHMVLNQTTLDIIYNNFQQPDSFSNIYFMALEIFNKSRAKKNDITLEAVKTFGKGKWLKFEGKNSNEAEYLKNAEELANLVKDTQWCTKDMAPNHLSDGDFFLFVDNDGKPHIAIKTIGKEIDEVRGILNGGAQELEEEYRNVALSFLKNNENIPNGKEWLEKEEWNKRLIQYNKKIDSGKFTIEDVPTFVKDFFFISDYKENEENSYRNELKKKIYKIKQTLAEYYNCNEEEIYIGDVNFSETDFSICPYRIIFGNVNFENSKIVDLGNLKLIGGFARFNNSKIVSLKNLNCVSKSVDFEESQVSDIEGLQHIGGKIYFGNNLDLEKKYNDILLKRERADLKQIAKNQRRGELEKFDNNVQALMRINEESEKNDQN